MASHDWITTGQESREVDAALPFMLHEERETTAYRRRAGHSDPHAAR
jgi:hypothetical protein